VSFLDKTRDGNKFPQVLSKESPLRVSERMPPEGVRRSSRIPKEIDILMVGSDTEGKVFSEQTKTVLLSRHGAGIVSGYKLSAEQELILRRLDTNKETEVRVVGRIGVESDIYTYGVAFLDSTQNFWGIQFPVPSQAEREMRIVSLECGSCQAQETVEQSDLESDVYLVNDGIVRFCRKCGSSTFWKRASEDAEEAPVVVEMVQSRPMGWVDEEEEASARLLSQLLRSLRLRRDATTAASTCAPK